MKFCQRCDRPLKDDQAVRVDNPGATGSGATVYQCKSWCRAKPRQTAPSGLGR